MAGIVLEILANSGVARVVHVPLHFCEATLDLLRLRIGDVRVARYAQESVGVDGIGGGVVFWCHYNRHAGVPDNLLGRGDLELVEDFVQAPFEIARSRASYSFNSLRKFCNLELAVAYGRLPGEEPLSEELTDYQLRRIGAEHVKYVVQGLGASELERLYLDEFIRAEECRKTTVIRSASILEMARAARFDFTAMIGKRLDNHACLRECLEDCDVGDVKDGAYMYLVMACCRRDELRRHLAQREIYTVVHWADSMDATRAATLLSFHIDHRYSLDEMRHVGRVVREFR